MRSFILQRRSGFVTAILILSRFISTARADALTPSYTVTDLGSGNITATAANGTVIQNLISFAGGQGNQELTATASGSPIVSISNGQSAYSFNVTPAISLNPNQGNLANFPVPIPAPVNSSDTYGNPANAYSVPLQPIMNANGVVVAIDSAGVSGHEGMGTAYSVQQNADGSWGTPTIMWGGNTQFTGLPTPAGLSVTGINNLNQVLGEMGVGGFSNDIATNAVVYDIGTHSLINLSNYLSPQGYHDIHPIAIDDQGRILLWAALGTTSEDTVLLTPSGLHPDPIPLATPEPASWAVMALAMVAFVAHRVRERNCRS